MSLDEINRKYEILDALKRRRDKRELQRAQFGVSADPVIINEIETLVDEITKLEKEIEHLSAQQLGKTGPQYNLVHPYKKLYESITDYFNEDSLRYLALHLGIDYEAMAGENEQSKAY